VATGLFYAASSLTAFLLQALLGRAILFRIGLAGSMASHPLLVGAAIVLGFIAPAPWRAILPRGLDVTLRASIFRAGYELFYMPLAEASKRAAKSAVDVSADCLGKGPAPADRASPSRPLTFVAVNIAGVLAAAAELTVARRLRAVVSALEGGLKRQAEDSIGCAALRFHRGRKSGGPRPASIRRALDDVSERKGTRRTMIPLWRQSPACALAIAHASAGAACTNDALLVGALVPLLANRSSSSQSSRR
jgi:hypothetical protein